MVYPRILRNRIYRLLELVYHEFACKTKYLEEVIYLTKMQVEWAAFDENARHNKAAEQEQQRHNERTEQLTAESNALQREANAETQRSHFANEALQQGQLNELIRHQQASDAEILRNHQATEQEIAIHNRNSEQINREANKIKKQTAMISAEASKAAAATKAGAQKYAADLNKQISEMKLGFDKIVHWSKLELENKKLAATVNFNDQQVQKWQRDYDLAVKELEQQAQKTIAEIDKINSETKLNTQRAKTEKHKRIGQVIDNFNSVKAGIEKDISTVLGVVTTAFELGLL